jgi:hypothetical protein
LSSWPVRRDGGLSAQTRGEAQKCRRIGAELRVSEAARHPEWGECGESEVGQRMGWAALAEAELTQRTGCPTENTLTWCGEVCVSGCEGDGARHRGQRAARATVRWAVAGVVGESAEP